MSVVAVQEGGVIADDQGTDVRALERPMNSPTDSARRHVVAWYP
jgi:hypothetical protein